MENITIFLWCADYQEHRKRTTVGRKETRKNKGRTIKAQWYICENVIMTVFRTLRR